MVAGKRGLARGRGPYRRGPAPSSVRRQLDMDKSSFYSYIGDKIRPWEARRTAVAQRSMLTHSDIWNAVDRLAARAGLSASGLAKKAGLDPTTFNKSKRITPEGRPRLAPTESGSKALHATSTTGGTFVSPVTDRGRASNQA